MPTQKTQAGRRVVKLFEPSPREAPPKAWAPGKPPGGKLPTQQSEAKDRQEKS